MTPNEYTPKKKVIKHKGIAYTIQGQANFDFVLITTPSPYRYNETLYYSIGTRSSSKRMPDYKQWKYDLLTDLDRFFLGRRMINKDDTLARYESLDPNYYHGECPLAVIQQAANLLIKNHNARLRHARRQHSHPIYKALEGIAKKTIKSYFTDFSHHDARIFARNPRVVFWSVDESGTWTYTSQNSPEFLKGSLPTGLRKHAYLIRYNPGQTQPVQVKPLYTRTELLNGWMEVKQAAQARKANQ